jgi:ABC-type multidrug transport system fused ATPase/permease subunit
MERKPSCPRLMHIVREELLRSRWALATALACLLGSTLATLAAPWPVKFVFDHIIVPPRRAAAAAANGTGWLASLGAGDATTALFLCCLGLVLVALLAGACAYGQQVITTRIGHHIVDRLRAGLFDHVQRLSLDFHHRSRSGETLSRITADTNALRDAYAEFVLLSTTHTLSTLGMGVILVMVNWKLGLLAVAAFPVLFVFLHRRLEQVKQRARAHRHEEGRLAGRISEILGAVTLVQAFGREDQEKARFDAESRRASEQSISSVRADAAGSRVVEIVTAVATAAVLAIGGLQALHGQLGAGDLFVVMTYVAAMFRPVRNLARLSARMAKARASVERIEELLATEPEPPDAPDAIARGPLRGAVTFEGVGLRRGDQVVLAGIHLHIRPGMRVAVVGPSGAGKSTLIRLLLRLAEPTQGCVRLDGVPLARYRRSWLRSQIGVVLQDNLLLGASIRDNITYGRPDASDEEVEAAARAACAHEFVQALPDGYEHVLGQGGATLSGGQRQRLCLARALLKKPALLLMDEPTSAIDGESARQIRATLAAADIACTTILVTHHAEMAAAADWVVVLREGRIVEQGVPADLERRGGAYAALFPPARPLTAAPPGRTAALPA